MKKIIICVAVLLLISACGLKHRNSEYVEIITNYVDNQNEKFGNAMIGDYQLLWSTGKKANLDFFVTEDRGFDEINRELKTTFMLMIDPLTDKQEGKDISLNDRTGTLTLIYSNSTYQNGFGSYYKTEISSAFNDLKTYTLKYTEYVYENSIEVKNIVAETTIEPKSDTNAQFDEIPHMMECMESFEKLYNSISTNNKLALNSTSLMDMPQSVINTLNSSSSSIKQAQLREERTKVFKLYDVAESVYTGETFTDAKGLDYHYFLGTDANRLEAHFGYLDVTRQQYGQYITSLLTKTTEASLFEIQIFSATDGKGYDRVYFTSDSALLYDSDILSNEAITEDATNNNGSKALMKLNMQKGDI